MMNKTMGLVLHKVAAAVLPTRLFVTVHSIYSRRHQRRLVQQWGLDVAASQLLATYGCRVLHGPFAGMEYVREALVDRAGVPKLLGSYEHELWPVFEGVVRGSYEFAVDIGTAEGYFAVGLARRAEIPVYAYETDPWERAHCRRMAKTNGVQHLVHLSSWCDPEVLARQLDGRRAFVLSDCEGYETELFTTTLAPAFRRCDLLIELHGDAKNHLLDAVESSHDVKLIRYAREATIPTEFPEVAACQADPLSVLREPRGPQEWAWCRARQVETNWQDAT